MGELGVLGMTIPEEYGGSDFSSAAYCRMMEVIGVLDASASIVVGAHQSIGIKPLLLFGTDEQKKKWLPDLATGKLVGAFCLTEPEAGSDAGSLKTTAVYDAKTDEYVLNGTKQWISNGGFASFLTVFARIPRERRREGPAQGDRLLRRRHEPRRHPARPLARPRGEEAGPLRLLDLPDHPRELPHPRLQPDRRQGTWLQGRPRDAQHRPDVARRRRRRRLEDDDQARGRARHAAPAVQDPHRRLRDDPPQDRPDDGERPTPSSR